MTPWTSTSEIQSWRSDEGAPPAQGKDPVDGRQAMAKWLIALKDGRPFPEFQGGDAEPGWDILLDLYLGELSGRKTSITSACIASRAPPTTALRHVNMLCRSGRIERRRDENDARRCWLELAPGVRDEIDRYLSRTIDDFIGILRPPS